MNDSAPEGRERRVYTRYDVAMAIEFEITGAAGRGNRMRGTTINVSRGGVLAEVGISTEADHACRIAFLDAGSRVLPAEVTGRVVHVGVWGHRRQAVAVQFDMPLDKLDPAGDA